jgi:hypothetical protein
MKTSFYVVEARYNSIYYDATSYLTKDKDHFVQGNSKADSFDSISEAVKSLSQIKSFAGIESIQILLKTYEEN